MGETDKKTPSADFSALDSFYVRMPSAPMVSSAEAAKNERQLLSRLRSLGPRAETLKPLAVFYSRVGMPNKTYQYLRRWLKSARDRNELAECLLMLGQLAEQAGQPDAAIRYYQSGLSQQSGQKIVAYFLHNNLAFCLNQKADFEQALRHGQEAVRLDASRSNAFKNSGVAWEGLGRPVEAAQAWIQAIHADASDKRALELLEALWVKEPAALRAGLPDLDAKLEACRRAVGTAHTGRFADWALGLTLN